MAATTVPESLGANVSVQLFGGSVGWFADGGNGWAPMDASSALCSSRQACHATRIWAFSRKDNSLSGKKSIQWFSRSVSWAALMPKVARVHPAEMSSADNAGAKPAWDRIWSRSGVAITAHGCPGAPGSTKERMPKKMVEIHWCISLWTYAIGEVASYMVAIGNEVNEWLNKNWKLNCRHMYHATCPRLD